jgi:hypothetical protein
MPTNNRLDTIANRQRKSRVRDAFFALAVAAIAMLSITSLGAACHAATTTTTVHIAQR